MHYHELHGNHAFLWEMAKFDPSQNQNPVTGWYEIVNIWLRPVDMPQIYFCKKIRAAGASGESGEI